MNDLREMLQEDHCIIGSWINTLSPVVTELMAAAGFDFLVVDAEHSAVGIQQTQVLFQAMASGNRRCAPLVRLPGKDYAETKRFMDAGAAGVIAPLVNSASDAKEVVRAVKYPPDGDRGVGFCRANMYGLDFDRAMNEANDRAFVCVQIEHIEGVEHIDEILTVPGIDAVFIGPYDLTASMGITAQFDHSRMKAAMQRILEACQEHGVAPGLHVVQPNVDEVLQRHRDGYRMIAYSLDITMLHRMCVGGLSEIRNAIGAGNAGHGDTVLCDS